MYTRWNTYSSYLKKKYGVPVYRIGVDAGFSCPNRDESRHGGCAFCDGTGSIAVYQRSAESGYRRSADYDAAKADTILPRLLSMREQIARGEEFLRRRYKAERFILDFQSWTNTYDTPENLRRIYDEGLSQMDAAELIVSTRPDTVPEPVLDLLSSYITPERDVWVEFGLQSASDETLQIIRRGHSVAVYADAVERAREHGLKVSTHVILGLPGEGRDEFIKTAECVNAVHSDAVKVHNLHITGGTALQDEYLSGNITVMSEERTLEATELFLRHLDGDIIIERLVSETPYHRLLAPRVFPDKSKFLRHLEERMERNGTRQGDLAGRACDNRS